MPKEIDRVTTPAPEPFLEDFVYPRRPVIFTDLFAGQPIVDVRTVDEAVEAWGAVRLHVQEEYTSAERADVVQPRQMALHEYVEFAAANVDTRLCCTEYDTPARILASYRLPELCRIDGPPDDEVFGLPKKYGDFDLTSAIFLANAGNVGHLHFDGDQRHVILHQVYGRKRVVLFEPSAAVHLRTLDGPYSRPSLAGVYLEDMSLEEKLELVERLGGYHCVLEPGETLFIPMLMWHHLEYIDDAMSFNVRFGRTPYGRFLSLDHFHRDAYIQNVSAKMVGSEPALEAFEPVVDQIKAEYLRPVADLNQRVRDMRALFRRQCAEVAPEAQADRICPPEREEEQVARIVASRDMQGALKYADPELIASTRPVGPVTPRQQELIEQGAERCAYSPEVMESVLANRVGKGRLDDLTKAEAAQVIAYLASPGAAW